MKYALIVYETESAVNARTDDDRKDAYWGAYRAYSQALTEAGVITGGAALQSSHTATTVQVKGGQCQVQDGPYADTKEQLGGFFIVDLPDLDAALEWAARCPGASSGTIEVRPLLPMT